MEEVLVLVLLQQLGGALHVAEEAVDGLDVLDADLGGLALLGADGGGDDHVHGVPEGGVESELSEEVQGVLTHVHILLLRSELEDLADLALLVGLRGDDQEAVKEVDGDAVGALVLGAADGRDAAVGGHDEDGGEVALQGAVEEGEALDVEHVGLIDEEHAGDDGRLALLSPLGDALVDLLADLGLDLSGVTYGWGGGAEHTGEEGEEALLSGVDYVDVVETDLGDGGAAGDVLCGRPPFSAGARPRGTARTLSTRWRGGGTRTSDPMASKSFERLKERPSFVILPFALSMEMTSPADTCSLVRELIIYAWRRGGGHTFVPSS